MMYSQQQDNIEAHDLLNSVNIQIPQSTVSNPRHDYPDSTSRFTRVPDSLQITNSLNIHGYRRVDSNSPKPGSQLYSIQTDEADKSAELSLSTHSVPHGSARSVRHQWEPNDLYNEHDDLSRDPQIISSTDRLNSTVRMDDSTEVSRLRPTLQGDTTSPANATQGSSPDSALNQVCHLVTRRTLFPRIERSLMTSHKSTSHSLIPLDIVPLTWTTQATASVQAKPTRSAWSMRSRRSTREMTLSTMK